MVAPVSVYDGPPTEAWSQVFATDGSDQYIGIARSLQKEYSLAVVSVSKAADAVFNITAHGLQVDNGIIIAGATGDWAALNGTHRIKAITDANNFTIETDTSAYGGAFDGTVTSRAPRTNVGIWSIRKIYNSTNPTREARAQGNTTDDKVWDSRTTYFYQ